MDRPSTPWPARRNLHPQRLDARFLGPRPRLLLAATLDGHEHMRGVYLLRYLEFIGLDAVAFSAAAVRSGTFTDFSNASSRRVARTRSAAKSISLRIAGFLSIPSLAPSSAKVREISIAFSICVIRCRLNWKLKRSSSGCPAGRPGSRSA